MFGLLYYIIWDRLIVLLSTDHFIFRRIYLYIEKRKTFYLCFGLLLLFGEITYHWIFWRKLALEKKLLKHSSGFLLFSWYSWKHEELSGKINAPLESRDKNQIYRPWNEVSKRRFSFRFCGTRKNIYRDGRVGGGVQFYNAEHTRALFRCDFIVISHHRFHAILLLFILLIF